MEVETTYPNLHFFTKGDTVCLSGSFPLVDGARVIDRFSIEIELPRNCPDGLPIVREIGGRIPHIPDRHILPDGTACLFVPDERWRICPPGTSLLNGPVRNFFLGQSMFELTGTWPFGTRSHGAQGIFESYSDILGTTDKAAIIRYLEVISKKDIKQHWMCPCGSGKQIRMCHSHLIVDLSKKIPHKVARESLKKISES